MSNGFHHDVQHHADTSIRIDWTVCRQVSLDGFRNKWMAELGFATSMQIHEIDLCPFLEFRPER